MLQWQKLYPNGTRGNDSMRIRDIRNISTSMGIAITILIGGVIVQVTDNLELFGHNSVIPLILGLSFIALGILFFVLLRLMRRSAKEAGKD